MKFYALGRLKTGQMNKTESAYAQNLSVRQMAGEVLWFKFEGIRLRLADNTMYNPDFAVMLASGELEMHEVKGYAMDDSLVKLKVANEQYPFRFYRVTKNKGGWQLTEIGNKS